MKNHKVTVDDFIGFFPKTRLCGQHGNGKNKCIDVVTDPINKRVWYEFSDHHKVIYEGPELSEAIDLYNNA
jgi:hypothetical protein